MLRLFCIFVFIFAFSLIPGIFAEEATERTPIQAPRLVNAFGIPVSENVNVHQQVQIAADIFNNQNEIQLFVYIVQIRNSENQIISLSWISGSLNPVQSFSPALSWTPSEPGRYGAEIFVWKSMGEPDALSNPSYVTIMVS